MGSLTDELAYLQAFKRFNPTVDRTKESRSRNTEQLCICVLGTSSRHLDLLLEGGDICPGDVMVALSPDWLQRRTVDSLKEEPRQVLLVKKALTFERGGNSYLDVFEPPIRVTYFINEMPEAFEAFGLDCAQNGSNSTMTLLEDRLLWRVEMSKMKLCLPPCLVLHGNLSPEFKHKLEKMAELKLVERPQSGDKEISLEHVIRELISTVQTAERKVLIGKRMKGGFQKTILLIQDAISLKGLSEEWETLCQDEYITIETTRSMTKQQNCNTTPLCYEIHKDTAFSVHARLTMCRGLDDQLILSKISASATLTSRSEPSGSVYKDLTTCLMDQGHTDEVCLGQVKESIKNQARAVMNLVIDAERSSTRSYIGPRTDYLELIFDMMLLRGVITPVLSDVSNQHMCLDTWGDNSDGALSAARAMLHVMTLRSHSVLLSRKTILYLLDDRFVDVRMGYFNDIKKYGNKIIGLVSKDSARARKYVDELIEYDLADSTDYTEHAQNILKLLQHRGIQISGCISLIDTYGMVGSRLRQLLGLPGLTLEATNTANEKYLTYSKLWTTPSARYSSRAVRVNNMKDLETACSQLDFPAFAKFDAGKGAIGARAIQDADDCTRYVSQLFEKINNNEKDYELINGNISLVLTELHEGDEYNVDVVLFQGQFMAGFIRLAVPAKRPYFTCRAQAFPAQLSADKESSILRASHQMCYDLGLHDGVFNVELMDTEEGPKLIEINGRPGGHGIVLLTKDCLDQDLLMMNNLVHVGIRPTVVALPPQRLGYSFLLSLRHHCHLINDETFKVKVEALQRRNIILYQNLRYSNFRTVDKVVAFLGVVDEDMEKSKIALLTLAKGLGLDTVDYPCADLLDSLSLKNGVPRLSR